MASPQPAASTESAARSFLTFRVGDRLYALPADDVAEVMHTPQFVRVPYAPKALIGLANLRGVVLPLVSLRGLVGLDEAPERSTRAVLLKGAALAVDSVEALVSVATANIETRQAELAAESGESLSGTFQAGGTASAKILDIKTMLDGAFAQRGTRQPLTLVRGTGQKTQHEVRATKSDTLVTFDVAEQEYALHLSAVREIVPAPRSVTTVPRSDSAVIGVMPFRDRLLPLLSLRGLLGFPPAAVSDEREKVVVAAVGGAVVGLVADRARAIVFADQQHVEPVPAVLAARSGGEARITAIYRGEGGGRLISILAPEQLFREDVMQRLGSKETAVATRDVQESSAQRQFLVFRLGDDELALPIEAVDEVARVPDKITRVPKTPKFLEGVVNLRGEVLPVVDQRRRFGMPQLERGEGRRLIIVRTERHRAGVIVDSVSEVLRSNAGAVEPPPDLTGEITRLVHGVLNLEEQGRIILLLDPTELLTRAEENLLDAFAGKTKAAS
jgi:purine-binding chemotaxis protein CheW